MKVIVGEAVFSTPCARLPPVSRPVRSLSVSCKQITSHHSVAHEISKWAEVT